MLNRVFWNWDIHYACNYRCSYCFLAGKWDDAAKENRYPGVEIVKRVWGRIYEKYGSCHIHFSGGEPFTYPDFLILISALIERHTLEFSTNLSFSIADFMKAAIPEKASIGASFHPQFADRAEFMEKVLQLKMKGYQIHVTCVAYPPQLKEAQALKEECQSREIKLVVQPFRGKYAQMIYPQSYSEQEKEILKSCGTDLSTSQTQLDFHLRDKQKENKSCHMGHMYGKIYASADVYRCCSTGAKKLGNILDNENFSLSNKAMPCEIEDCLCWRRMLTGEEDKWASSWGQASRA